MQLLVFLLDYFSHKIYLYVQENQVSGSPVDWAMVNNRILLRLFEKFCEAILKFKLAA